MTDSPRLARILRIATRTALGGAIFMFTSASSCNVGAGDRASTGLCPEDEVCDPDVRGLHFKGTVIGEAGRDLREVKTLAVGGRQDVTLLERIDVFDDEYRALQRPYAATFDTPAVAIESSRGNVVSLRGTDSGDGYLRIADPETSALFDRVRVAAEPILTVRLMPSVNLVVDNGSESTLYAAGSVGFVGLLSASGAALVDEDARIAGANVTQAGWDRFTVGAGAPGMYPLTVAAGDHAPAELWFEVGVPTRIVALSGTSYLDIGRPQEFCFGARANGRPIHAPWRFEVTGATLSPSEIEGCANVTGQQVGSAAVTAFTGNLKLSLSMTVAENPDPPSAR